MPVPMVKVHVGDQKRRQTKVGHDYLYQGCLFTLRMVSSQILESISVNIQLSLDVTVP